MVPTGESYVGSYAHPTGRIPESGVGLPPGKKGGKNHGWWDRFSRGHPASECRWSRLEIVAASEAELVRERRNWWVAQDRQQNPAGNRNGNGSGTVAGFRSTVADRVASHLKSRRASVAELAAHLAITAKDARKAISCIRARDEPIARDGKRYYIRGSS